MRVLVIVAALALASAPALATPSEELGSARQAFRDGRFKEAVPMLTALLYPQTLLANRTELAEAHLLLGVSYFELGDPQSAGREFDEALFIDSTIKLDPLVFSRNVARFFDDRRRVLDEQNRTIEQNRKLAAERDEALRALKNTWVVERRAYYVNYIPFGAGQFQNGHRKKGIAFAVSQSALGFTSAALFTYLLTKYRLQNDVPVGEAETVRNLQILQVTTGGITLGLMAWGIVDALIYHEPTKRLEADKSYLPKELRDKLEGDKPLEPDLGPKTKKKKKPESSFRLVPVPHTSGGGFVASWEF